MMKAQDLKNSILQMAMEGKLVPQDPNDEPASVLLERIREEKEHLIKEKKIKRNNKESFIFRKDNHFYEKIGKKGEAVCIDDEIPWDIPDSWEWVRFGTIVNFSLGKTPQRKNPEFWNNGTIPWVSIADMEDGEIIFSTNEKVNNNALVNSFKNKIVTKGTLLMSFKLTVGKVSILGMNAVHNEAIISINPLIDEKYIFRDYLFWILPMISQLGDTKSAIKGKTLNSKSLNNLLLPMPNLNQQKKIVKKINELNPLIEQYSNFEEELETLNNEFPTKIKNSILQDAIQGKLVPQNPNDEPASVLLEKIKEEKERLIKEKKIKRNKNESFIFKENNHFFEKIGNNKPVCIDDEIPFDIPDSWEWCRLGFIGDWKAGSTPKRGESKYYENGTIPWLKTGDLNNGIITEIPEFITELALEETSIRLNPIGSVLIAMYGATIGKVGILDIESTTNQACCACILFSGIFNKYLFYYLMSQNKRFNEMAEGGAQPNISRTKIVNYLFPVPPLKEQKRIVEKVNNFFELFG